MKAASVFVFLIVAVLATACGSQPAHEAQEIIYVTRTEYINVYITPPPTTNVEQYIPHQDVLISIMNDTILLDEIRAVVGAPLYFNEDDFFGFPFVTVLPNRNVIVAGLTDWAQNLTIYLRPDHTNSSRNWILEAYDITGTGIVLAESFTPRGTMQVLDADAELRIYHTGIGWHGDWWDGFVFTPKELCATNWASQAILYIQEITDITIRDIWFEGTTIYIELSPIESFVAWGPASYRSTLLYLTAASLPGVEHVFIMPAQSHNWLWAEIGYYSDFEYTGHQVLRGHHWAWVGAYVAQEADTVLAFFEDTLSYQLHRVGDDIAYTSGGNAHMYYNYLGRVPCHDSDTMFHVVRLGELWPHKNEDEGRRVHLYWFYINEDMTVITWRTNQDPQTKLSLMQNQ